MSDLEPQKPSGLPITIHQAVQATTSLIPAESDDFLPSLGRWSHTLGQKVFIGAAASLLALAIWPWRETVRAAGVIRPAGENTIVQSQLDGALATVWVKENQQVRKGQALAALDRERLSDERRQLESELRESLAQQQSMISQSNDLEQQSLALKALNSAQQRSAARDVDSARATLRFREIEWQRYRKLLKTGSVQEIIVDEKEAQVELARNALSKARQALNEQDARGVAELARLRQGRSQNENQRREATKVLEDIRSRLAQVQRALANSVIKAPTAGTVISSGMRHAQQVIRAGEVLAQIAPLSGQQLVKVRVASRDIGSIKSNQDAYLRISGCPYPEYGVLSARVKSISADTLQSDTNIARSGGTDFEVTLDPVGNHLESGSRQCLLRQGMDVQADIVTKNTTVLGLILTKLRLISGT